MPPRSVCLNVFTTSLGEAGAAVREGRDVNPHELSFGRRDSAQSLPDDGTHLSRIFALLFSSFSVVLSQRLT
jgi:hypothetical protein